MSDKSSLENLIEAYFELRNKSNLEFEIRTARRPDIKILKNELTMLFKNLNHKGLKLLKKMNIV